jgi:hypothetical protein
VNALRGCRPMGGAEGGHEPISKETEKRKRTTRSVSIGEKSAGT